MSGWNPAQIPGLAGKRALVTGVTSGIGRQTAAELARAGAEVILGARNQPKLHATIEQIKDEAPGARLLPLVVDVADQASIRRAAAEAAEHGALDLLVNNAGVMGTPYQRTVDGFELQHGTNHLGPFALTGLLLDRLAESGDGRVVAVASQAHRLTRRAPLGDPRAQTGRYRRWQSYARSKLANLLFTYELDRRAREQGVPVRALAAHPGYASTGLMGAGLNAGGAKRSGNVMQAVFSLAGQQPDQGAWPTLMAATAELPGSTYVGPDGFAELWGPPEVVTSRRLSHDRDAQHRLWQLSEEATGVRYLNG